MKQHSRSGRPPDIPSLLVHLARLRLAPLRPLAAPGAVLSALVTISVLTFVLSHRPPRAHTADPSTRPPTAPADTWHPSIASDGTSWGIAWSEPGTRTTRIRFARLAHDGRTKGSVTTIAPDEPEVFRREVHAASGTYGFAVAWSEASRTSSEGTARRVRVARLHDDGTVDGSPATAPAVHGALVPMLAGGETRLGVAWTVHDVGEMRFEQHFAQLDRWGKWVEGVRVVRRDASLFDMEGLAEVDGAFGLLAPVRDPMASRDALALVRLRDDGVEESATTLTERPIGSGAVDAADGGFFAAVWTETEKPVRFMPRASIAFATVDRAGLAIARRTIVPAGVWIGHVNIAASPDGFGVVWESAIDDGGAVGAAHVVLFSRLDRRGVPSGPRLRLSSDDERAEAPAIAWSGTRWGVAWRGQRGRDPSVRFTMLDAAGRVTGPPRSIDRTRDVGSAISPREIP